MKIGFDGKRAIQNFTGLGNYSRYIIELLLKYFPENEYVVYAPRKNGNPRTLNFLSRIQAAEMIYPDSTFWKKLSSIWRIFGLTGRLEKDGIEIFHGLSGELPLNISKTRLKKVVTIHDLIFLRFPQYYKPIDRKIYKYKFRKACLNADKIIAISECTKRDIMHFFGIAPDKIEVIYQGCDSSFADVATDEKKQEVKSRYNLPDRYILSVGSIEERKNALLAVKAMPQLPAEAHLVLVGKRTDYTGLIETFVADHQLNDRVHILDNVTFADLPAVYQQASVFVYPSRFEGFGIPIIEAMQSGVPVVAATGSCLEEAGGEHSIYVNPDSVEEMTNALLHLLSDEEACRQMVTAGRQYITRFSEKIQADDIMRVYTALCNQ